MPPKKLTTTEKKLAAARARGEEPPVWISKQIPAERNWHLPGPGVRKVFLDASPVDHMACGFELEEIEEMRQFYEDTRPRMWDWDKPAKHRKSPDPIDWDALKAGKSQPPKEQKEETEYDKEFPPLPTKK